MENSLLRKYLSNKEWRVNNLYKIKDKNGKIVTFKRNLSQQFLSNNFHYRNVILKARQLGITTDIAIDFLDSVLFIPNIKAGMIAENQDKTKEIFDEKIKFAYDNLPKEIKAVIRAEQNRSDSLKFNNGSSIQVSTSFRSGTVNLLHVSELGKICAKYPEKAKEIKTGSLQAVPKNGIVYYESTAEGQYGYFYDTFQEAYKNKGKLSQLHFKPFFFAWFLDPEYKLPAEFYDNSLEDYFNELKFRDLINLTPEQKAWYYVKKMDLKEEMWQEYPSTPDEAFKASVLGAYYTKQILKLRELGLVNVNCYDPDLPVWTAWDKGISDSTAIWFFQVNKFDTKVPIRIIDYYENSGEGLLHYAKELKKRGRSDHNPEGYKYASHIVPHDMKNREYFSGISAFDKARAMGIDFVLSVSVSFADGIDQCRDTLINEDKGTYCVFDIKAREGVLKLERYKKKWNEKQQEFLDEAEHDSASHCADSFRYLSVSRKLYFGSSTGIINLGI